MASIDEVAEEGSLRYLTTDSFGYCHGSRKLASLIALYLSPKIFDWVHDWVAIPVPKPFDAMVLLRENTHELKEKTRTNLL